MIYLDDKNSQNTELINSSSLEVGAPQDMPGGSSNSSVSHIGATEISSDTTSGGESYSSEEESQNALLVTGGT